MGVGTGYPQQGIMWRERESLNWGYPSSLPLEVGEPGRRRRGKIVGVREYRGHQESNDPLNLLRGANMGSQRLKQQAWDLQGSTPDLCVYVIAVGLLFFWGGLLTGKGCVSEPLPALGTLFFLLSCLVQPPNGGYCLTLFCHVCLLSLALLWRLNGGVELGKRVMVSWEEWREGELLSGCIAWENCLRENELFSKINKNRW